MQQLQLNKMDFNWDDLFNLTNTNEWFLYPTEFDNLLLSSDLQPDSLDMNELFPDFDINLTNSEDVISLNGDMVEELQSIITEGQNNNMAMINNNASNENSIEEQNATETNFPTPQKAVGGDAGIMYLVKPGLFGASIGNISVKQQPKANTRFRYLSDGARFLPDSRYHPLSLELPEFLKLLKLQSNQILGVVATLATITDDKRPEMIVHANDLAYRIDGAIKIGYGCVFVPIDPNEIIDREKKFSRLSIIYKKCDEYTFQLIPFNTTTMFGFAQQYISSNQKNTGVAARGKDFKRDYSLLSYKIVFQLAVKQDDVVYISEFSCSTEDIHETAAPSTPPTTTTKPKAKKGTKRASSFSDELGSEDESVSNFEDTNPSKRSKTMASLPITRVSGQDTSPSTINHVHC